MYLLDALSKEKHPMNKQTTHDLKNLVFEWYDENYQDILTGIEIQDAQTLLKYENQIKDLTYQLRNNIVNYSLCAILSSDENKHKARQLINEQSSHKMRNVSQKPVTIKLLSGGKCETHSDYYARKAKKRGRIPKNGIKRGKKGNGLYPLLAMLGISDGCTPALRAEIAREVSEGPSMETARGRLKRRGIDLDIKQIKRISERFAQNSLVWRSSMVNSDNNPSSHSESLANERVVVSIDGGRVRTRQTRSGRKPKDKRHHRYDTPWKEPKIIAISSINEKGRRKRGAPITYDGTIDNLDRTFMLLEFHLKRIDVINAKEVVFICDGSPPLWLRISNLVEKLGFNPNQIKYVVDYYHVCEYLWEIAELKKGWNNRKRKKWVKMMKSLLKLSEIDDVIYNIETLCKGRNSKKVRKKLNYFIRHKNRMDYGNLMAENIPIGSGMVESAIRRIVNLRLKGAGIFWKWENAEGFLHLRCHLLAGRWNSMVKSVIQSHALTG